MAPSDELFLVGPNRLDGTARRSRKQQRVSGARVDPRGVYSLSEHHHTERRHLQQERFSKAVDYAVPDHRLHPNIAYGR